jgi:hypothetical protein
MSCYSTAPLTKLPIFAGGRRNELLREGLRQPRYWRTHPYQGLQKPSGPAVTALRSGGQSA